MKIDRLLALGAHLIKPDKVGETQKVSLPLR